MKYFTPELIERLGSSDPAVANEADAEWDRRQQVYERELQALEERMPESIREFSELLLHDALAYNLARHGDQMILVLHKDIPPRQLVIVTYDLAGEPYIDSEAVPEGARSEVMAFEYDELEGQEREGKMIYRQSILFSNGWEVRLEFADVRFVLAEPLLAGSGHALPRSA